MRKASIWLGPEGVPQMTCFPIPSALTAIGDCKCGGQWMKTRSTSLRSNTSSTLLVLNEISKSLATSSACSLVRPQIASTRKPQLFKMGTKHFTAVPVPNTPIPGNMLAWNTALVVAELDYRKQHEWNNMRQINMTELFLSRTPSDVYLWWLMLFPKFGST